MTIPQNFTDVVLYVLMRTDLDSLNPGKAMAQANHAYGALKAELRQNPTDHVQMYLEWQKQTDQDFGTTLTLGGSERQIYEAVGFAQNCLADQVVAGWVLDPTYPISDGQVTHLLPIRTCAYIFGQKEDCSHAVRHLSLHP